MRLGFYLYMSPFLKNVSPFFSTFWGEKIAPKNVENFLKNFWKNIFENILNKIEKKFQKKIEKIIFQQISKKTIITIRGCQNKTQDFKNHNILLLCQNPDPL